MPLTFYFNDLCPKCRKQTMQAVMKSHPTSQSLAIQKFHCTQCGPVKTKFISIRPMKPEPDARRVTSH